MNAIQPSRPPVQHEASPAPRPKKTQRRPRRHAYKAIAVENTARLCTNVAISAIAAYGLAHLLPHLWSQQQKWQEISTEVQRTEGRVNNLQQDFQRYFDPRQTETLMKQQSNMLEPGESQVIWQHKPAK